MSDHKKQIHEKWEPESITGKILATYARKVPSHPSKIRIFRWLASLMPDPIFTFRCRIRFRVIIKDYIGNAICFKGVWEPISIGASIEIMRGHESKAFLDVGANHGIFSLVVGGMTGCTCLAIEPEARNYQILKANLSLNPSTRVHTYFCAATAESTRVYLSREIAGAGAWTKVTSEVFPQEKYSVQGRPLNDILKEAGCKKVRLMKIDVEGFELEVFKGLDWESPMAPEVVLMECSPADAEKINFLITRGYRPETVEGRCPKGLKEYPEGNLVFRKK